MNAPNLSAPTHRRRTLAPRFGFDAVHRGRVFHLLDGAWNHPLTLVSAPAGYGKTTAIRTWELERRHQLVWLTLEDADNHFAHFARDFFVALQSRQAALGQNAVELFSRPSRPDVVELAETLADEVGDFDEEFLLVLDECEKVSAQDTWLFLETLLLWAPANVHLVLATRVDPPLALSKFRMRGEVLELRVTELQFHVDETAELLRNRSPDVTPEVIDGLQRLTHGWAAGVRLGSLALQTDLAGRMHGLDKANPGSAHILDSLVAEVLNGQPDEVQESLLVSSIPAQITPALLAALTHGDTHRCHSTLEAFRGAGLCSELVTGGNLAYQLHPLFQDLLGHQLRLRCSSQRIAELQQSCAEWHRQQGRMSEAIHHMLLAGGHSEVATWLETEIPVRLQREEWRPIRDWLQRLPDEVILSHPYLALGWCWSLLYGGQWAALSTYRERVRQAIERGDWDQRTQRQWLAEIAALESLDIVAGTKSAETYLRKSATEHHTFDNVRGYSSGHYVARRARALQFAGQGDEAIRLLKSELAACGSTIDAGYSRLATALVLVYRQLGDFAAADQTARDCAELFEQAGLQIGLAWMWTLQGIIAFERNDLSVADTKLSKVVDAADKAEITTLGNAMLLLARSNIAKCQFAEASGILRRARELFSEDGASEMLPGTNAVEAWLALESGRLDDARSWAMSDSSTGFDGTPEAANHGKIIKIRILLRLETLAAFREALDLVEELAHETGQVNSHFRIPEVQALKAIALAGIGNDSSSCEKLFEAMHHPLVPYTSRSFLDLGGQLLRLLQRMRQRGMSTPQGDRLLQELRLAATGNLGAAVAPANRNLGVPLLRMLTDRELSVLERLDQRLTYKEIGDELSISPLTVKRHVINIYDKLGSNNRREALLRARDLGWTNNQ